MAAQPDFVRGEDQAQALLLPLALEFGVGKLVKRQQQALFSQQFDFDRASARIARPTVGSFCAHVFVWVEGDDDEKA